MNIGLIQVENAYNDLVNFKDDKSQDISFRVLFQDIDYIYKLIYI